MSTTTNLFADEGGISFFFKRITSFYLRYPECWVWLFSLLVWAFLVLNPSPDSQMVKDSDTVIYCMPTGAIQVTGNSAFDVQSMFSETGIFSKMGTAITDGMMYWIIMIVAMMFPLLNEPTRHVAFSVRRKDRNFAILLFLIGYTLTWTVAGVLFILLPHFLSVIVGDETPSVTGIIKASGFLLAAILTWMPARPRKMTKCSQTMPIRIDGRLLYLDSLSYGLKVGISCLSVCWAVMAALMLAHHNLMLMYTATIILMYERYLLQHTSKLPGYAWGFIALTLFGIEMMR